MTKVMPCICANPYQDRRYGLRLRVYNEGTGVERRVNQGKDAGKYRGPWKCTSCGRVRS